MSLVLRNKGKGMQRSSEQPLVGEERYVTTLITAAKETRELTKSGKRVSIQGSFISLTQSGKRDERAWRRDLS